MIDIVTEIRKRYGNVRRARGYYLYTEKNIRLLDLWLDGGKAILGRRTGQAHLMCKQFLDRGLTGIIPTKADAQLARALQTVFPDYPVIRWYYSEEKAKQIARSVYGEYSSSAHRLDDGAIAASVPVWRPFLGIDTGVDIAGKTGSFGTAAEIETVPLALITPVYPMPCGIIAAAACFETVLPPSDALFPPLVYSLARGFFDLKRKEQEEDARKNDANPSVRKGLKQQRAALRRRAAVEELIPALWTQKSCYLFPHIPRTEYAAVFTQALDAHVLISPDYDQPSVLPSCGSYSELAGFLKSYRNESQIHEDSAQNAGTDF